ncbi:hypothetical protein CDAR_407701 [Caerostris darwini]|uniref:Uncharacterized protein n=1 Tax=Caerostris darwini TaxID=1538125 RepID=A0AAV4Q012_9ARAC|nr:hypothetical protein CDAR_407701 [Caerostris darwini]
MFDIRTVPTLDQCAFLVKTVTFGLSNGLLCVNNRDDLSDVSSSICVVDYFLHSFVVAVKGQQGKLLDTQRNEHMPLSLDDVSKNSAKLRAPATQEHICHLLIFRLQGALTRAFELRPIAKPTEACAVNVESHLTRRLTFECTRRQTCEMIDLFHADL